MPKFYDPTDMKGFNWKPAKVREILGTRRDMMSKIVGEDEGLEEALEEDAYTDEEEDAEDE